MKNITNIIFSKDRAIQLDLLLDGLSNINFSPVNWEHYVIYTFSSSKFEEGYHKLMKKYPNIKWILQNKIDNQVIDLIDQSSICGFITDDSYFWKTPKLPNLDDVGVYSMRYGLNTVMQDPFKRKYQPILNSYIDENNYIKWNSEKYHPLNNYGFLISMDGHYFKSKDIIKLIDFNFNNPSQLETEFFKRKHKLNPWIRSEKQSSLVNVPLNNAGGYTEFVEQNLEELNQAFLNDKKLKYKFDRIIGSHQILEWQVI